MAVERTKTDITPAQVAQAAMGAKVDAKEMKALLAEVAAQYYGQEKGDTGKADNGNDNLRVSTRQGTEGGSDVDKSGDNAITAEEIRGKIESALGPFNGASREDLEAQRAEHQAALEEKTAQLNEDFGAYLDENGEFDPALVPEGKDPERIEAQIDELQDEIDDESEAIERIDREIARLDTMDAISSSIPREFDMEAMVDEFDEMNTGSSAQS